MGYRGSPGSPGLALYPAPFSCCMPREPHFQTRAEEAANSTLSQQQVGSATLVALLDYIVFHDRWSSGMPGIQRWLGTSCF